jgi:hypothetical protein
MRLKVNKQYRLKDYSTGLDYCGIDPKEAEKFSGTLVTIARESFTPSEGMGYRIKEDNTKWWWKEELFKEATTQKGETKMSIPKVITDSYKETKDAVLVDKWFTSKVGHGNAYEDLMFVLHKDEILKEAKRLQKAQDDATNRIVCDTLHE